MKVVVQKKNKKWYLGTFENGVFTREKTYATINGTGVKKYNLADEEKTLVLKTTKGVKVYGVKEEVIKKRGRKADPTKVRKPKVADLKVDENLSDAKKEKAFEKIWWKNLNKLCLSCKNSCKQSAMVSLYCPQRVKI